MINPTQKNFQAQPQAFPANDSTNLTTKMSSVFSTFMAALTSFFQSINILPAKSETFISQIEETLSDIDNLPIETMTNEQRNVALARINAFNFNTLKKN